MYIFVRIKDSDVRIWSSHLSFTSEKGKKGIFDMPELRKHNRTLRNHSSLVKNESEKTQVGGRLSIREAMVTKT